MKKILLCILTFTCFICDNAYGQTPTKLRYYGSKDGLTYPRINCLTVDSDGFVWIGSNAGITCFDGVHMHTIPMPATDSNDGSFAIQPRTMLSVGKYIWIGTKRGIFIYDKYVRNFQHIEKNIPEKNPYIRRMALDKSGKQVWAESETNLYKIDVSSHKVEDCTSIRDKTTIEHWSDEINRDLLRIYGLDDDITDILSMTTDNNGGLWMGTLFNGLYYYDTSQELFHALQTDDNGYIIVRNIIRLSDGNIIVGTENKGLYILAYGDDGMRMNPLPLTWNGKPLTRNIQSLTVSKDNDRLWIGTGSNGMFECNTNGNIHIVRHYGKEDGSLGCEKIICSYCSNNGNVWVGTLEGLFVLTSGEKIFRKVEGAEKGYIHALAETSDGHIWIGSLDMPLRVASQKTRGKWLATTAGFTHPCVTSLHSVGNTLYIGTDSKGLWEMDVTEKQMSDNNNMYKKVLGFNDINSSVNTILDDGHNNIYISSFNGLFKIDTKRDIFTHYTQNDGLPTNYMNYSSGIMLSDSTILLGTYNGTVAFNPSRLIPADGKLKPFFTNINIGGVDSIINENIYLEYDSPSFYVDYSVPVYNLNNTIWYRYRLKGAESDSWNISQGGEQRIYFSHLSPGDYLLQLEATSNPSKWQGPTAQMRIIVHPPFWMSKWAYILYALILLAIVWVAVVLYKHRVERQSMQRESEHLLENRELMLSTSKLSPFAMIKDITKNAPVDGWMERLDLFLENNLYNHELGVELMAEHMNVSNSTLYRRIKSSTSLSPNEYIRLYRLKNAAQMLRQDGLSIRQVSEKLCFSSVAYFTNSFSQVFGISPGKYANGEEPI